MSRVITYVLGYNDTGMIHNNKDLGWNRTAYDITLQTQGDGNISASPADYGFPGQTITLSNTASPNYQFNSYQTTGATLTGNQFTIGNEDVTAKAVFDRIYKVTTKTNGHGQLVASPTSGINGTTVGLTATPSSHYSFNQYSITGATLTSNNFNINGSDITVSANFVEDPKYTVTLSTSGQGKVTANKTTGYVGDIITLSNTASANYAFVNYSITGATLTGNKFAMGNSNVTVRANYRLTGAEYYSDTATRMCLYPQAQEWIATDVSITSTNYAVVKTDITGFKQITAAVEDVDYLYSFGMGVRCYSDTPRTTTSYKTGVQNFTGVYEQYTGVRNYPQSATLRFIVDRSAKRVSGYLGNNFLFSSATTYKYYNSNTHKTAYATADNVTDMFGIYLQITGDGPNSPWMCFSGLKVGGRTAFNDAKNY